MSSHTADTALTFLGKLILEGEIHCQTGLHIGAGKGSLEIGGADNPVVKDAFGIPYIPGSSLRGRLRALLGQPQFQPLRVADQVALALALNAGVFDAAPVAEIVCIISAASLMPSPAPPYSCGMAMPSQPESASAL